MRYGLESRQVCITWLFNDLLQVLLRSSGVDSEAYSSKSLLAKLIARDLSLGLLESFAYTMLWQGVYVYGSFAKLEYSRSVIFG
jgi:hypothetical protein